MKYFVIFFLTLSAVILACSAADCEVKNHKFNTGEKYQPTGECTQLVCDGPGLISAKGCPVEHTLEPCEFIPMDTTKPYPKCCPKFDC